MIQTMFSSHYEQACRQVSDVSSAAASGIRPVPGGEAKGDPNIARLTWMSGFGEGGSLDQELLDASADLKQAMFHGRIYPIVPLYVTSICSESCLYCNFRGGNKGVGVVRRRLSDTEVEHEARYLIEEKGLRVLELVYASDPMIRVDAMCRHVERLKHLLAAHGGGMVGINAEALEEEEYRRLGNAGLTFSVLWQETYDRVPYWYLHPGRTKKARFEYRLDAYERMLAAGISQIGMGVLSGLSDWRKDWAMLMQHEAYLLSHYGKGAAILGLPRLKPAPGAYLNQTPFIPSREEFLAVAALHNIFSPTTLGFVSTREDWETCIQLAQGGGCLFTFNCSTTPGGYTSPQSGCQFPVHSYDAPEHTCKLRELGLTPQFAWTFPSAGQGGSGL